MIKKHEVRLVKGYLACCDTGRRRAAVLAGGGEPGPDAGGLGKRPGHGRGGASRPGCRSRVFLDSFAMKFTLPCDLGFLFFPDLSRRPVAVPTDPPPAVVGLLEGKKRQPQLLDGLGAANPEKIFLEDTDKAFGNAVALWLAHVGCRERRSPAGSPRR